MRTVFTFRSSDFNTSEHKPYFINPGCFGDDLAHWLIAEMRRRNVETDDKPSQEDFGWFVNLQITGIRSTLVLAYRPGDENEGGVWIGWIERSRGFPDSVLDARNRDIDPSAVELIDAILSTSSGIGDVRWHFRKDFDKGNWAIGSPTP